MSVKLFLLGIPGSGKSTVAHYIESLARDEYWSVKWINDYAILRERFEKDQQEGTGCFKPAEYGGFDVVKFKVVDEALQELERQARSQISLEEPKPEIVLLEFARNDYSQAFQQFSCGFLQDAYFLYLDTDKEICRWRIEERITDPQSLDNHYVSDHIFQTYYHQDNGQFLASILTEYNVDEQKVKFLKNNGDLQAVAPNIEKFIRSIMGKALDRAA